MISWQSGWRKRIDVSLTLTAHCARPLSLYLTLAATTGLTFCIRYDFMIEFVEFNELFFSGTLALPSSSISVDHVEYQNKFLYFSFFRFLMQTILFDGWFLLKVNQKSLRFTYCRVFSIPKNILVTQQTLLKSGYFWAVPSLFREVMLLFKFIRPMRARA